MAASAAAPVAAEAVLLLRRR
eukprot:COSAG06_NODE_26308_length_617_cov_1.291506_1_plen_20_part_10